jgi:hypothetical protein
MLILLARGISKKPEDDFSNRQNTVQLSVPHI